MHQGFNSKYKLFLGNAQSPGGFVVPVFVDYILKYNMNIIDVNQQLVRPTDRNGSPGEHQYLRSKLERQNGN